MPAFWSGRSRNEPRIDAERAAAAEAKYKVLEGIVRTLKTAIIKAENIKKSKQSRLEWENDAIREENVRLKTCIQNMDRRQSEATQLLKN